MNDFKGKKGIYMQKRVLILNASHNDESYLSDDTHEIGEEYTENQLWILA